MRIVSALPCLLLLLLPAAAAPDGTAAYLAARDRYIAEFKLRPPVDDPSDTREARALADLDRQLTAIIPPWRAPNFSGEIRTNVSILHQDLGFGTLDGLAYGARGSEVIVTTPALLQNWITGHGNTGSPSRNVPQTLDAAFRSSQFWGFSYGDDNGWLFFGEVPVTISGGRATAQLAVDTDSGFPDTGPRYLLVTALRGDRVFVARQNLGVAVARQPDCDHLLRTERGPEDQVARDFQACYAPFLHTQPQWDAIRGRAQSLVDLLH